MGVHLGRVGDKPLLPNPSVSSLLPLPFPSLILPSPPPLLLSQGLTM